MEDELNSDLTLMRNWSRNVVLPMIAKKYKGLHKVVFKKMKKHLDEIIKD
jgi:tRNA(Ile)-lysidine synthase TilS/MesJ